MTRDMLKIGVSRITPAKLFFTDPDKILQAELKSHALKIWRPGPKGRKLVAKKLGNFS